MGNPIKLIRGKALVPGEAAGEALVSSEPLSFWGGYESSNGEIIDRRHTLNGQVASGRILVIPYTRGSSTTTAVLLESVKKGTAPAAIITRKVDSFLCLASIVADEMYGKPIPIVATESEDFASFETGQQLEVRRDGAIYRTSCSRRTKSGLSVPGSSDRS
jgi:predicted aconitase with swiveling domain